MNNNKICGYSCEHNKGGVCQITGCNKSIKMTTTTDTDYTKFNISMPLFETNELEKFDIYIDEIAKDFTQKMLKDKDMILAQRIIKHQQHKIDKAIEYIEKHRKVYKLGVNQETDEFDYISTSPQVLLNILRGEDK